MPGTNHLFRAHVLISQMLIEMHSNGFFAMKIGYPMAMQICFNEKILSLSIASNVQPYESVCFVALEMDFIQLNCSIAFENEINAKF